MKRFIFLLTTAVLLATTLPAQNRLHQLKDQIGADETYDKDYVTTKSAYVATPGLLPMEILPIEQAMGKLIIDTDTIKPDTPPKQVPLDAQQAKIETEKPALTISDMQALINYLRPRVQETMSIKQWDELVLFIDKLIQRRMPATAPPKTGDY